MRALLLVHRFLGLAFGALLLLWCGSGVVMMYVSYPKLAESRRLQTLTPIDWQACRLETLQFPNTGTATARVEMLDGRPVLSLRESGGSRLIDLASGASSRRVPAQQAAAAAAAYAPGNSRSRPQLLAEIELDQWTVSGQFAADRPLYHFGFDDHAGTELYVSSVTGRLVQATTRRQRFWNWLGPIPHWLYWTELRRHPRHWSGLVIAGALLGCLLTISGLWLGFQRLPRRLALAPASRARAWHRASGLVFGVFTLTWLGTGLLTMQPWGLLESPAFPRETLYGRAPSATRLEQAMRALQSALAGSSFVSVEITHLDGEPSFLASTADGRRQRFDAAGRLAPLSEQDFAALARRLGSQEAALRLVRADEDLLAQRGQPVTLPVYQVLLPGSERNALYLDATSAAPIAQIDRNARVLRWIEGLHRVDCLSVLRRRPLWDALVLLLLSGVGLTCGTGIWLGYKRLFVRQR